MSNCDFFCEEIPPHVHPKPSLAQLESVSSPYCLSTPVCLVPLSSPACQDAGALLPGKVTAQHQGPPCSP